MSSETTLPPEVEAIITEEREKAGPGRSDTTDRVAHAVARRVLALRPATPAPAGEAVDREGLAEELAERAFAWLEAGRSKVAREMLAVLDRHLAVRAPSAPTPTPAEQTATTRCTSVSRGGWGQHRCDRPEGHPGCHWHGPHQWGFDNPDDVPAPEAAEWPEVLRQAVVDLAEAREQVERAREEGEAIGERRVLARLEAHEAEADRRVTEALAGLTRAEEEERASREALVEARLALKVAKGEVTP